MNLPLFTALFLVFLFSGFSFGFGITLLVWDITGWNNGENASQVISITRNIFPFTVGLTGLFSVVSAGLFLIERHHGDL